MYIMCTYVYLYVICVLVSVFMYVMYIIYMWKLICKAYIYSLSDPSTNWRSTGSP